MADEDSAIIGVLDDLLRDCPIPQQGEWLADVAKALLEHCGQGTTLGFVRYVFDGVPEPIGTQQRAMEWIRGWLESNPGLVLPGPTPMLLRLAEGDK